MAKTVSLFACLLCVLLGATAQRVNYTDWQFLDRTYNGLDLSFSRASVVRLDGNRVLFAMKSKPVTKEAIAENKRNVGPDYEYSVFVGIGMCGTGNYKLTVEHNYDRADQQINEIEHKEDSDKWESLPSNSPGFKAIAWACGDSSPAPQSSPAVEYGQSSELKGVRSFYVYTDTDLELHDNIVYEIKKRLPGLALADRPETADVVLIFSAHADTFISGVTTTVYDNRTTVGGYTNGDVSARSAPRYSTVVQGKGLVVRFTPDGNLRMLETFQATKSMMFQRKA